MRSASGHAGRTLEPVVNLSEQEHRRQRWKAALSEPERALVDRAFAADAELEGDLEALVGGLSPNRQALFLERFVANLEDVDRGQNALLLALEDLARTRPAR